VFCHILRSWTFRKTFAGHDAQFIAAQARKKRPRKLGIEDRSRLSARALIKLVLALSLVVACCLRLWRRIPSRVMKGAHATQESYLLHEVRDVTLASPVPAPGIVAAVSPRADPRNLPLSPALLSQ